MATCILSGCLSLLPLWEDAEMANIQKRATQDGKEPSRNNLNNSRCVEAFSRSKSVVPLAMKFVALNRQLREFLIGHLDTRWVGILIQSRLNAQSRLGSGATDQLDHHFSAEQGTPPPVGSDVTEHPMFNLVPLAGSRREVAKLV